MRAAISSSAMTGSEVVPHLRAPRFGVSWPSPGCRVLHHGHSIRAGGKERVLLGLAAAGREAGHDDRVSVFDHPPGEPELDIDPGQVPVDFLARGGGLDLRYIRRLARYLRTSGARVIRAHNDSALVYAVFAAALLRKPKPRVIATLHNAPSHPTSMARRLTRWCAARAHGVTCVSAELRDHLIDKGWIAEATVTPNGVDLQQFQPDGPALDLRAQLDLPSDALLVGMPARMGPGKRFEDLASALSLLPSGWTGIIAGEGPERPRVQALVDGTHHLHLLPHQRNMPAFLRGLDAVCLFSDHEGQGGSKTRGLLASDPIARGHPSAPPNPLGRQRSRTRQRDRARLYPGQRRGTSIGLRVPLAR